MPASHITDADSRGANLEEMNNASARRYVRLALAVLFTLIAVIWLGWEPVATTDKASLAVQLFTATPTLAPNTGAIAGYAWQDSNANSFHDPGETLLAGMQLTLSQGGQVLFTATTGPDGEYRFASLGQGVYTLVATPPTGYQLTTDASYNVFVTAGAVLQLNFGARFVPTPTPTATPIPTLDIDHAPFASCGGVVLADTAAGHNDVRRYACRPEWNESGPELVYRIELGRGQLLTAVLLNATADLDLFLLPSAYPETCLVAGDNYISFNVQPGIFFLAVDGYQGASGTFTLRLECPYATQATITPTPTPSATPTATATFTPGPTPSVTPTRPVDFSYLPLAYRSYPLATAEPVTLTFQQDLDGYTGTADTMISVWETGRNFGDSDRLRLRYVRSPEGTDMAPLLRFNLALLPTEATIVEAKLKLYLVAAPKHDLRGQVHGLLHDWDEYTATWLQAAHGVPWAMEGARDPGGDYTPWSTDIQQIEAADRWYTFDVTDLVRIWVSQPSQNFGLILLAKAGDSDSNVEAGFASREHTDRTLRPQLTVAYWVPAATTLY
ncbi:MAG: hypothetical protein CVT63_03565 [Candidatus Anoxymicrobium japonicum]|uniref:Uncharacterized protein n=1 Tax=Candidatus Anoxymicrobium japonicum TaxID=2013648 RepID=A0A2N3G6D4_9ACTN|nr:MAG: hypothetical protein CVT63_03565 [Candidatus Anoxymicrobium japonicum]